jgi:hypothetical protein
MTFNHHKDFSLVVEIEKALLDRLKKYVSPISQNDNTHRKIFIRNDAKNAIEEFFTKNPPGEEKFKSAIYLLNENKTHSGIYKHEKTIRYATEYGIGLQIWAIRFNFNDLNTRIYCVQLAFEKRKWIILWRLLESKKTQKHNHIQKNIFEKIEREIKVIL